MPTLADVKRVAKRIGATVENNSNGSYRTYNVIAPTGKLWSGDGIHCLLIEFRPGEDKGWASDSYADALDRMSSGVEPCDGIGCDFCDGII